MTTINHFAKMVSQFSVVHQIIGSQNLNLNIFIVSQLHTVLYYIIFLFLY